MSIPGSILLAQAMSAINPQPVEFFRALGAVPNDKFRTVIQYSPKRTIWGSFQPLSAARVMQMGLKTSNSYATFYAQEDFVSATREGPADHFEFAGRRYEAVDVIAWLAQDGWDAVVVVDIGPARGE